MAVQLNQIGENAGKVWRLLNSNPNQSCNKIAQQLGLARVDVTSALGWLARENKVIENEDRVLSIPNSRPFKVFSVTF